jgi:heat-inducible transcriptional repressor
MLDARKTAILRTVVAEHIRTGQPVGSSHVVRDSAIDVSPATVRADMSALEREGYLTHPHTSAGRIPTDAGYRFFVDHLDPPGLDPARSEQVQAFFNRTHGELDRLLLDTSRLLSELTDHAAVVVAPAHEVLIVRSAILTRLAPRTCLFVAVLSNGAVDKHVIEIDEEVGEHEVTEATNRLGAVLVGTTFGTTPGTVPTGNLHVDRMVEACLLSASREVAGAADSDVFVGGTSKMASQFPVAGTVHDLLAILEQSVVVVSLLSEVLSLGQSVAIGAENGAAPLAECSLVVAPYELDDEVVGTIGVLGPTRMNYPQALAAVAVVSQHLGRQLSNG